MSRRPDDSETHSQGKSLRERGLEVRAETVALREAAKRAQHERLAVMFGWERAGPSTVERAVDPSDQ